VADITAEAFVVEGRRKRAGVGFEVTKLFFLLAKRQDIYSFYWQAGLGYHYALELMNAYSDQDLSTINDCSLPAIDGAHLHVNILGISSIHPNHQSSMLLIIAVYSMINPVFLNLIISPRKGVLS